MFGKKQQKHHIIEVIDYEGPQDVFIWKHPAEDFNTKSQLIVRESQEAIFFRNGQALDVFPSGRYTLETQNLPLLRKVVGLATGGVTPFQCEVYYINKAVSMGIDWGTDSPIQMMDVEYGVPIFIRSYGDYSLRVKDARKMLVKLVGTMSRSMQDDRVNVPYKQGVAQYTQDEIKKYFNEILAMHIRDCIANSMINKQIGGMEVNTQLISLAQGIKAQLSEVFNEYGIELNHFTVSNVSVKGLEEFHNTIKKVKLDTLSESGKAGIERIRMGVDAERIQTTGSAKNAVMLEQGMAEAAINQAKGITEAQKLALGLAEKLAANTGPVISNFSVPGADASNPFGNMGGTSNVYLNSPAGSTTDIIKTVFNENTKQAETAKNNRKERLNELKEWFDDGLISEEEYATKRKEIIDSL